MNIKIISSIFLFLFLTTIFTGTINFSDRFGDTIEEFHDYDSLTIELQNIATMYPNITNLFALGESVQGRTIWGLKITDNPLIEENEAEVRICGAHHGDELMSLELPLLLAWHLVQNYSIDPYIKDLIDNREIMIIPLVNPDGRMATPSPTRRNANNVNINADYGYIWEVRDNSQSPYSQPETQALMKDALDNFYSLSLSFHCYGDIVNYVWNHKGTPVRDENIVVYLSNLYGSYNNYWVVEGYDWYRITGDINDFSYGCYGGIDWTIEVQHENIPEAWDLNRDAMIDIIDAANIGLTGIVTDNITGQPLSASIWIEESYWPCFTDPKVGDYHKPLLPGNYTIHFRANGYEEIVYNIDIIDSNEPTYLNISLNRNYDIYAYQVIWYYCNDPFEYPLDYENNPTEGISALGPPDNISASIGVGGEIVLDMGKEFGILDVPGEDFVVFEGDLVHEGYYVQVSENWNGPWILLGFGMGTSSFDLSYSNIDHARFIKIIDDGDGDPYELYPGFDLDAIHSVQGPELSFNPSEYDFGAILVDSTDFTTFDIWNSGIETLTFNMSETCDWVHVNPLSGESTGEHDTITVDIDTTGLTPGMSYHGDIMISSNGGSGVFDVDIYVVAGGSWEVYQEAYDRGFPIRHAIDGDWGAAQNFTPTGAIITDVELYLRSFGTPEFNLNVELREDDPQGTLIDSLIFTPEQTPSSWEWFNIDFDDTTVTPSTDYFIVCPPTPSGVTTSFGYEWGYAFDNQYDDGSFWFTRDGGGLWRSLDEVYEFTFRTYGYS